jgi:ABC-type nitrate/sulfonate/bicarbonate transport system permease component
VKILAVALQSFTIVMLNCSTGFNNIDPLKLELMKSLGATRMQRLKHVILPSSLPNIFNGMRMSAISASTAALATEFYSSTSGLGARIMHASSYLQTELMFACIVMVAVTGITLYLLPSAIEKLVIRWRI